LVIASPGRNNHRVGHVGGLSAPWKSVELWCRHRRNDYDHLAAVAIFELVAGEIDGNRKSDVPLTLDARTMFDGRVIGE